MSGEQRVHAQNHHPVPCRAGAAPGASPDVPQQGPDFPIFTSLQLNPFYNSLGRSSLFISPGLMTSPRWCRCWHSRKPPSWCCFLPGQELLWLSRSPEGFLQQQRWQVLAQAWNAEKPLGKQLGAGSERSPGPGRACSPCPAGRAEPAPIPVLVPLAAAPRARGAPSIPETHPCLSAAGARRGREAQGRAGMGRARQGCLGAGRDAQKRTGMLRRGQGCLG